MPNPKLRFYFREPTIDTNIPITDGTVKIDGFDFEFVNSEDEADAWDCGFAARIRAYAKGLPHISIPAFPNRKFRLSYIFVNSKAGIESPKDLEGKRVGIMQWDNTAGVWARGALQHYYGVDLTRINWLAAGVKKEGVAEGIRIEKLDGRGDADTMLDRLLADGALDAVIGPNVLSSISNRDPRTRRLFRDYRGEEQTYFKKTGIFPTSHIVTLKREFVDRHPNAPVALLQAFRRSRDEAFNRLEGPDPQIIVYSWMAAAVNEQRELMGENYWAYNIENNRRTLDAITQFAHEQGLSPTRIDYKSFFHREAAAFPGV
ncbi:MAG TPA: ABC transporter substrate-binding protein [Candidatus Binatia bacterium]|jgi:4,5-dihydroxyphthalate decarboxylase|nr:ABC transporter substrate-binding protein [Candidatus Binatia bacterium]